MATQPDDGRVWGRPEALDTLGRLPGRHRRSVGTVLGALAIGAGAYLGFTGPAIGAPSNPITTATTTPAAEPACGSVAITLPRERVPVEGIVETSVLRLSRADPGGAAQLLVPEAFVVKVAPTDNGIQMSVLVRTDPQGGVTIEEISRANADGSLNAALLYDVDKAKVVNTCRGLDGGTK